MILLVCDLAVAQALKHTTEFWQATYPPMDHRIRSEKFHHKLVKNRLIHERWGPINYSFATNSLGFKDAKIRDVPIKTDRKRVLFMGDSFTEGSGFSYPETFVGRVAAAFEKEKKAVLNGANASYAPEIYYRKIRHLIDEVGLQLDHVILFIDVSDILDEITQYRLDKNQNLIILDKEQLRLVDCVGHWLRDNSLTARFFTVARDNLSVLKKHIKKRYQAANILKKSFWDITSAEMTVYSVVPHFASEWTYNDSAWKGPGEAGRKKAAYNMRRLSDFLKSRSVGLTIAVYPWPDQIIKDPKAPRHRGFWQAWASANRIPFIDFFPLFTKGEPYATLGSYFLPNDVHWNKAGHAMVAKEFMRQFKMPN